MTRREYRLEITWPVGRMEPTRREVYRRGDAAGRARREYELQGATVKIEVWGHAGQDMAAGWYRESVMEYGAHGLPLLRGARPS